MHAASERTSTESRSWSVLDAHWLPLLVATILLVVVGALVNHQRGAASALRSRASINQLQQEAITLEVLRDLYGTRAPAAYRSELSSERRRQLALESPALSGPAAAHLAGQDFLDEPVVALTGDQAEPLAAFDFDARDYVRATTRNDRGVLGIDVAGLLEGADEHEVKAIRLSALGVGFALAALAVGLAAQVVRTRRRLLTGFAWILILVVAIGLVLQ